VGGVSTLFIPSLWSDAILKEFKKGIMGAPCPTNFPLADPKDRFHVKLNQDLEAYFVAIALEHGTHPEPTFGMTRNALANELTIVMSEHPGTPLIMQSVRRNYVELGGKRSEDLNFFYTRIADAYLDWLYSQPESMALMPEALAKLNRSRADNLYSNTRDPFKL